MNKKEIRKLNERIASDKLVSSLSVQEQINLFEQMLESEGLTPIDSFECVPSIDLTIDSTTDRNNRWQKVNANINDLMDAATTRKFQEVPFNVISLACKSLRCITINFPNEGKAIKASLTEVHTA